MVAKRLTREIPDLHPAPLFNNALTVLVWPSLSPTPPLKIPIQCFQCLPTVVSLLATVWHFRSLVLFLLPWRWRRHVPPKQGFIIIPHGATSQKMSFFITAIRVCLPIFKYTVRVHFKAMLADIAELHEDLFISNIRPPLWSNGQSSWLQNGDVLCLLWGTNWIYVLCRRK
jgi:hypothetical protein